MKIFSFHTVRTRLTFWNVSILALALLALGAVLRVSVQRNLTASVDKDLAARVRRLTRSGAWRIPNGRDRNGWLRDPRERVRPPFAPRSEPSNEARPGREVTAERRPTEGNNAADRWRLRLFDLKGAPLFPNGEVLWDKSAFGRSAQGQEVYATLMFEEEPVRVLSVPLHRDGQIIGVAQVGYPLTDVERALSNLNTTLLTLIPVALATAWVGGMFLTGRILRPVREVTQAAARLRAEDLSRRLPVTGRDEFSNLATTFNEMLSRLEQSFEQQRRFTADASHELRTPLTVIKGNTSLALSRNDLSGENKRVLEAIDKAAGHMNRIVQDLLLLARSDSGQLELNLRPTHLQEILETAVECVQGQGESALKNSVIDSSLVVKGDIGHLTRLFVNLLDNAIRHTPPEGHITLSARQEGNMVAVKVEDTGSGIAPEHLPHVRERFYRVDTARSRAKGGTGLGLAICQSIVEAHQGSLEITSFPGQGTTVRVFLPLAEGTTS